MFHICNTISRCIMHCEGQRVSLPDLVKNWDAAQLSFPEGDCASLLEQPISCFGKNESILCERQNASANEHETVEDQIIPSGIPVCSAAKLAACRILFGLLPGKN